MIPLKMKKRQELDIVSVLKVCWLISRRQLFAVLKFDRSGGQYMYAHTSSRAA